MMEKRPATYEAHSRDYLDRARQRLDEMSAEALSYAALELRLGIEARLREYASVQDDISEKKKRGWRIARLANDIERVFGTGDKIIMIAIEDREDATPLYVFRYTPVSSKLREMGERLGNYLHTPIAVRFSEDNWWKETRDFLEEVYDELKLANVGTMLGVPLRDPKTNQVRFVTDPVEESPSEAFRRVSSSGSHVVLRVTYLDEL